MSVPHENRATASNNIQKTPTRQRDSGFSSREENSDRNSRHYKSERTMPFSRCGPNDNQSLKVSIICLQFTNDFERTTVHLVIQALLSASYSSKVRFMSSITIASCRRSPSPKNAGSYLSAAPRTPESPIPAGYVNCKRSYLPLLNRLAQISVSLYPTHGNSTISQNHSSPAVRVIY